MIKLIIYYTAATVIQAGGKLQPVQTYWGNYSRKQPSEANKQKDINKLTALAMKYKGKYKTAILYDMETTPGKEIQKFIN